VVLAFLVQKIFQHGYFAAGKDHVYKIL